MDYDPISIHAPREGGDYFATDPREPDARFQSTPPARGATRGLAKIEKTPEPIFQSTPPARGATVQLTQGEDDLIISIHAPREGGDSKDAQFYLRIFDK